jgi:hypothetical protein
METNYKRLFEEQMDSLRDYGLQKDGLDIGPGIVHIDKDHRKTIGPRV